jgi:hypothetical protein
LLPFQKSTRFQRFDQVLCVGDGPTQQARDAFQSQGLPLRRTRQMGDDFNAAKGSCRWHSWHNSSWLDQIKLNKNLSVAHNTSNPAFIIYSKLTQLYKK